MEEYTAYDYYDELNMLFDENTDGFGDYYDFYQQTKAYDLFSNDSTGDFTDKDIATMQKKSCFIIISVIISVVVSVHGV